MPRHARTEVRRRIAIARVGQSSRVGGGFSDCGRADSEGRSVVIGLWWWREVMRTENLQTEKAPLERKQKLKKAP